MNTTNELPPVDDVIGQMNQTFADVATQRKVILDKLMGFVPEVDIKGATAARDVEVRLAILKTADDILKSVESNCLAVVKVAQQRKDSENNAATGERMAEMLRMIDMRQAPRSFGARQDPTLIDHQLHQIFDAEAMVISPEELMIMTDNEAPIPKLEDDEKEDDLDS